MFISEVQLENFLSFGSATLKLHPHLNVLVGKNGSGKSNLVEAVAFVLQGTKFDPQERRHVIHEEAASKRKTRPVATVRLIIDNSDRRLAVEDDVVVLARTMGPIKEDSLTLQGQKILRDELQGLLESAGFSKFNPYYIVRQGQVSHLSSCSNRRRLEVVQDLTGERVFDSSRSEADKRMTVTKEEIDEIDTKMEEMSVRMEELDADNAQLRRYLKEQRLVSLALLFNIAFVNCNTRCCMTPKG